MHLTMKWVKKELHISSSTLDVTKMLLLTGILLHSLIMIKNKMIVLRMHMNKALDIWDFKMETNVGHLRNMASMVKLLWMVNVIHHVLLNQNLCVEAYLKKEEQKEADLK